MYRYVHVPPPPEQRARTGMDRARGTRRSPAVSEDVSRSQRASPCAQPEPICRQSAVAHRRHAGATLSMRQPALSLRPWVLALLPSLLPVSQLVH